MQTYSSAHFWLLVGMTLFASCAVVIAQQVMVDQANLATKDFVPPVLKSLQLSSLKPSTSADVFKPIINDKPWHPSTSCQPLHDAINSVRVGSALRPFLSPDGPTFATMASPLYAIGSTTPLNPARRVLVSASNSLIDGQRMSVLVHWHGTGGNTISQQELDNMSPTYSALRNTLVLAPTSAIGPSRFEWHLVTSDGIADVWLMDDLVACLGKSERVDTSRIYISGMSAGGLHASYLAMLRPHYLAAAVSFSGGITRLPLPMQNATVPAAIGAASAPKDHPYSMLMPRTTPMLAIAGGPTDVVLVRFPITTDRLHRLIWTQHAVLSLTSPGIKNPALVRCDHTQGHRPWMGPEAVGPFLMESERTFRLEEVGADALMRGIVPGDAGMCRVIADAQVAGVNVDEVKAVVEQMAKAQGVGVGQMAGKDTASASSGSGNNNGGESTRDACGKFTVGASLAMVGVLGGLV